MTTAVRLAHFSDVHLTTRPLGWALRDLGTKKLSGWFKLHGLGRARQFRQAHDVARALVAEVRTRRPDRLVFSGDATALGFAPEFAHAAKCLHVGDADLPPGLAVPGNHDYYTRSSVRCGAFEHAFAPWLTGTRVDAEVYPFAQQVGQVWLIAVNSATPNLQPWDASGAVGPAQRERLRDLLKQLSPGLRIMVTHYPVCHADGSVEGRWHGLRDVAATVAVAANGGVGAWLHGHIHTPFFVAKSLAAPFPIICAGSATQLGRASYCEYEISGKRLIARGRVYDVETSTFRDGEMFDLAIV